MSINVNEGYWSGFMGKYFADAGRRREPTLAILLEAEELQR
jgi:hypothetical protein